MSDFLPREPDVLKCGCELTYRASDHYGDGEVVEIIFLVPCSEGHRRVAEKVTTYGHRPARVLVVKGVKS